MDVSDAVVGSLLGTAIGDALGLPYEGLSPRRAARLLGAPDRYRFLFGRGMVSDDTDHACFVAQALIRGGLDPDRFGRSLAWSLRFWLLSLPAGVGFATLRAILKLQLGFSYRHSGVFSAGNGPAMRSAMIGAAVDDTERLLQLVRVNARITHTDPRAEWASAAVALAARHARLGDESAFLEDLRVRLGPEAAPLVDPVARAAASAARGETTAVFCAAEGLERGVTGFALHTVPVAIHVWLRHPRDLRSALSEAIRCGGDTDTVAAIVGGIIGAGVGAAALPKDLLDGILEWPRSVAWISNLGAVLGESVAGRPSPCPGVPAIAVPIRNLFFLAIVLGHGFRRLLPPY